MQKSTLRFSTSASEKFQKLVAPYVHPSMEYKLLPRFRGKFSVAAEFVPATLRMVPAQILDIHVKPPLGPCTASISRWKDHITTS